MEHRNIYTPDTINRLELGWGRGWLSHGGSDDVRMLLSGYDLGGKRVLDIGVGTGGPARLLVREHAAEHVTGIDVEQTVLDRAAYLNAEEKLEDRITLQQVRGDVLPLENGTFDVVFSKDVFVHVADKARLFAEVFRVLVPGGHCLFSYWCCSPPPYSDDMKRFMANGMDFSMATIDDNVRHLKNAGFKDVTAVDRCEWFTALTLEEHRAVSGPRRARIIGEIGLEKAVQLIAATERRAIIALQGHLRPAHFSGVKPA